MGGNGLGHVVAWYICTAAAVPFVALRMYSRWTRIGKLAIEDFLIILALCCFSGELAIQQHMWNLGLGDMPKVKPENFKGIIQMVVPASILYVSALWAVKFALVFFYKRLAAPGSRLVLLYNITLGGLVAMYLFIFFDSIFQCFPHDKQWSMDPKYKCGHIAFEINYWTTVLFNIFSDVVIIALPIIMVSRLQIKLKQKLAVAGVFALGFFVIIASIIRAIYSLRNKTMLTCTVSMAETAIAIIAACLPALRSMIIGGSTNGASSYGQHYELSSTRRKTQEPNRLGNSGGIISVASGSRTTKSHHNPNGSEDSLVKAGLSVGLDGRENIRVDTTIETMYDADTKSRAGSSRTNLDSEP
ncbi:hypothetical protein P171DRAFT_493824 [Karstenula rhodostoma CBS 690.94]|uniref:Rhodopsin domain-containing protein n=1 Tax=Karstenula rhodostoma CBS 690.94 TaxID=1392251 RepID=A0A9P4UHF7_9PLEO|nr:hypothetical protein P171DRAFT_493824 [Karstenula rhodostoma CBS 690.94]